METGIWHFIIILLIFILIVWIFGRILNKAGRSRWWVLLIFVPIVNFIMIWVFAFTKWPRLE